MTPEIAAVLCTLIVVGGALAALVISRQPSPAKPLADVPTLAQFKELQDKVSMMTLKGVLR